MKGRTPRPSGSSLPTAYSENHSMYVCVQRAELRRRAARKEYKTSLTQARQQLGNDQPKPAKKRVVWTGRLARPKSAPVARPVVVPRVKKKPWTLGSGSRPEAPHNKTGPDAYRTLLNKSGGTCCLPRGSRWGAIQSNVNTSRSNGRGYQGGLPYRITH